MTDDLHALLPGRVRDKEADDSVFTWPSGMPVRDFRVARDQMCKAAKVSVLSRRKLTVTRQIQFSAGTTLTMKMISRTRRGSSRIARA
jgi:hypothetical protein